MVTYRFIGELLKISILLYTNSVNGGILMRKVFQVSTDFNMLRFTYFEHVITLPNRFEYTLNLFHEIWF